MNNHSIVRVNKAKPAASIERREAILDAALQCFVDRGFHGTAIPQIAKRAGIAAGTIYHYFTSKEALVNSLFRKWKSEIAQRVFTAFPQTAPPREQFATVWRAMMEFATTHPAPFAFLELHNHSSYLDDESQAIANNLKDFARMMILNAQEQGLLKAGDPTVLMELVFGAFNGMMRAHWEGRFEMSPEAQHLAEEACWDAVAGRASEQR